MAKLIANNLADLRAHLSTVWREQLEYPVSLEVKAVSPKRSSGQNALFHSWLPIIADKWSSTPVDGRFHLFDTEFVKARLKAKFGMIDSLYDPIAGKEVPFLVSTTKYEKEYMSGFLMRVEVYCSDMEILLPVLACKTYETYREAQQ